MSQTTVDVHEADGVRFVFARIKPDEVSAANDLMVDQWGVKRRKIELFSPPFLPAHFVIKDTESEDRVVAYAKLNHGDGKDGQTAAVWSVVVSPTVRRMGVGTRLMAGLEEEARRCGKVAA